MSDLQSNQVDPAGRRMVLRTAVLEYADVQVISTKSRLAFFRDHPIMTTALCFNCGKMKFGAWCPCSKCGVATSGDRNLDILFSDHEMSVPTLERFGEIIKQIAQYSDDPDLRCWVFLSYLTSHPVQLLTATPPVEVADRVKDILTRAQLPIVDVELKSHGNETGPPAKPITVPKELLENFLEDNPFDEVLRVQVRRKDGLVVTGFLMNASDSEQMFADKEIELKPEEIVAIRAAPGCLIGWLIKPPWTEAE